MHQLNAQSEHINPTFSLPATLIYHFKTKIQFKMTEYYAFFHGHYRRRFLHGTLSFSAASSTASTVAISSINTTVVVSLMAVSIVYSINIHHESVDSFTATVNLVSYFNNIVNLALS